MTPPRVYRYIVSADIPPPRLPLRSIYAEQTGPQMEEMIARLLTVGHARRVEIQVYE